MFSNNMYDQMNIAFYKSNISLYLDFVMYVIHFLHYIEFQTIDATAFQLLREHH